MAWTEKQGKQDHIRIFKVWQISVQHERAKRVRIICLGYKALTSDSSLRQGVEASSFFSQHRCLKMIQHCRQQGSEWPGAEGSDKHWAIGS